MSSGSNKVSIGLCQISVGSDKQTNLDNAVSWVRKAKNQGAQLVVLPECFNCPYGTKFFPDYAEEVPTLETQSSFDQPRSTFAKMAALSKELGIYLVAGSIPEREGDLLYNTSMAFDPSGQMVAKHRKVHLFDIDVPGKIRFMESEALSPGKDVGHSIFETSLGLKVGVGICFDVRFPELAQIYQQQGCNLLVYPGAFNMTTGPAHWDLLARGRAVDNQLFVAMCSPARDPSSSYVAYGHSLVTDPWGTHVARADHKEQLLLAPLDVAQVEAIRQQIPALTNKRLDLYTSPKLSTKTMSLVKIESADQFKQVINDEKLVVVDFWAPWCGPCKMIGPFFEELSKQYDNAVFVKVDIDQLQDIAEEYEIVSIPTFIFFKGGKQVDKFGGASQEKLETTIKKHL